MVVVRISVVFDPSSIEQLPDGKGWKSKITAAGKTLEFLTRRRVDGSGWVTTFVSGQPLPPNFNEIISEIEEEVEKRANAS